MKPFPRAMILHIFAFLLLRITTQVDSRPDTGSGKILSYAHIHVQNGLSQTLTIHCKSKEDDLGFHPIVPQATYDFTFRPRVFFGHTLFFCSFQWANDFHRFDIYNAQTAKCLDCKWLVQPNGPCLWNNDTQKYDICSPWNPPVPV